MIFIVGIATVLLFLAAGMINRNRFIFLVPFGVILIYFISFHFQDEILKYFYPVIILSVLPLVKVKLIKKRDHLKFKESISKLKVERENIKKQTDEAKDSATELEKEINSFSKLYELSEDIEKVISPDIIVSKSLEAINLKIDVSQLAFYSPSGDKWKVSYVRNIDNVSAQRWLKKLEGIKNSPETSFLKFYLKSRRKKSGLIILKVKVGKSFTAQQIKEAAVLVNQMSLGYEKAILYEEVKELSRIDGLTGLYLRRHFLERLSGEIKRGKREGYKIAFLMMDIDDFKSYNDTYGHPMGDNLLEDVSRIIKECIYSSDLACRYGGEEFCVYMPMAEAGGVLTKAEKIRELIEKDTSVTISIGISYFPADGVSVKKNSLNDCFLASKSDAEELIKEADVALYKAKEKGKNQIYQSNRI